MFIEINLWANYDGTDFPLGNSLFGAVRLTKNADPNKYYYSGYGTGFGTQGKFSLSDVSGFGRNVIIFGIGNGFSAHAGNWRKGILILDKGPTVNSEQGRKFCLSSTL